MFFRAKQKPRAKKIAREKNTAETMTGHDFMLFLFKNRNMFVDARTNRTKTMTNSRFQLRDRDQQGSAMISRDQQ